MTTVLVVDDSPTARLALRRALEGDPAIQVVGEAADRETALALVEALRPQLVTMDVYLRHEDGIEVTAALMSRAPVPILVVTGHDPRDPRLVYEAMEAGALEVFGKLPAMTHPDYEALRRRLVRLVKTLAGVRVIRRRRAFRRTPAPLPNASASDRPIAARPEVVLLGASTGGPPVLARILGHFDAPAPVPIVVVQHMAAGFGEGFARWLATTSGHRVVVVEEPLALEPGTVFLAPTDRHLVFEARALLALSDAPPRCYQRPSVDVLFESAAREVGSEAVAALLTGMGRDGAAGLLALKQAGAGTLAQEPATCAVPSMPEAAIAAGAAECVLAPDELARRLTRALAPGSRSSAGAQEP